MNTIKKRVLETAKEGQESLKKLILADKYNLKDLRRVCMKYAVKMDVCNFEKLDLYDKVSPQMLIEIHVAQARRYKYEVDCMKYFGEERNENYRSQSNSYGKRGCCQCDECKYVRYNYK